MEELKRIELLKHDVAWFFDEQGIAEFGTLESLEDRTFFLYSCLIKQVPWEPDNMKVKRSEYLPVKEQVLFRVAFFLADAVLWSGLPYGSYPAVLNPAKNPFVAYLTNTKRCLAPYKIYYTYMSIIHGVADPMKKDEWIYDNRDNWLSHLAEINHDIRKDDEKMIDPELFKVAENLQVLQLKLLWHFAGDKTWR